MTFYKFKLKKVVLPALLLAIAVVGMQLSSCKKKKDSPTSTQVSLANVVFKDTTLLTKATAQTYVAINVPQGVTVAYAGSIEQAPGEYTLTATFTLNGGFTWAATEMPNAAGKVEKTAKVTIADYLTAPTTATDGSNAVAIIKASDIYPNVTIPATLFGLPVVSIDSAAFENNTTITSVKVPENVTYVGKAFWGCTNLTTIDLPSSLLYIEMEAFVKTPTERGKQVTTTLTKVIVRATTSPKIQGVWYEYSTNVGEETWNAPTIFGLNWGTNGTPALTTEIYVPDASANNYKNQSPPADSPIWGWNKYDNIIKTFTEGGIN